MKTGDIILVNGDLARFVRHNPSGKTITVIFDGEEGESVVSARHCQTDKRAAIMEAMRLLAFARDSESLVAQIDFGRKAAETLDVFLDK